MRSNSTLLLTLKPYPPKCVQWPELKGVDEEAAVFMNRLPPARKPEIWKILNTSMSCREKLSILEDDLNRGEVKLVKKWLLRRFPPKEPLNDLEPQFLNYLRFDDSKKATDLVEQNNFEELDLILENYSNGAVQLYEQWKASVLNENQQDQNDSIVAVRSPMRVKVSERRLALIDNKRVWLFYYSIIYSIYMAVIFYLFLRIKEVVQDGRLRDGRTGDWFLKSVLYLPSIAFTFYYPFLRKHKSEHPSIASPWLRRLISVVTGLFVVYEVVYIILCWSQFYGWTCSSGIIFERILELFFFIGLAVFVTHNNCYPRENKLYFAHLCSSAVFAYLNILIQEEVKIYEEILQNQNFTSSPSEASSVRNYTMNTRGYRMAEPIQPLPIGAKTLFEDYFEMCYVVISEFLIVAIFINLAILNDLGNEKKPQKTSCDSLWNKSPPLKQSGFWIILLMIVMVFVDSSASIGKTSFIAIHIIVLAAGTLICLNSLKPSSPTENEKYSVQLHEESPADILDRYLLNFGAVGMLGSITVGTIHLYGTFSEYLSFATFVIYGASIVQVVAQTLIILSGSRIRNIKGWNGKALWLVNFALFCLDLYNAATLGVYSMPIPKNTNLFWACLVRGLGSFEVFYRFHSLAVIAENIEFHGKMDEDEKWSGSRYTKQKNW